MAFSVGECGETLLPPVPMKAASVSVNVKVDSVLMKTPFSTLTSKIAAVCPFSNVVEPELGRYDTPL